MKKILSILLAGSCIVVFSSLAFAHESKSNTTMNVNNGANNIACKNKDKDNIKADKCKMMSTRKHAAMMKCFCMNKSMVATTDGGIIVLVGNKLQKYDKDLVLVKETEVKMDFDSMHKMMQTMKKQGQRMEKAEGAQK